MFFLFTIDFLSLYTNIPVEDAMNSIKQLVWKVIRKNSLMTFDKEYFQKFFGVTNKAPILANIYMAKLENLLTEKSKTNRKIIWPVLFERFLDDGIM